MYPPTGPPHIPLHQHQDEHAEYPINDTSFIEHRPVQSPFSDPYPLEQSYTVETHEPPMPVYDNQPLLYPNAMPMPYSDESIKPEVYNEQVENVTPTYFTGAPRRQPRRYKTSKFLNQWINDDVKKKKKVFFICSQTINISKASKINSR